VRNFLKLKGILNILVPSLVRDKISSGQKNFSNEEGEVTIVFIDISEFDNLVRTYSGNDLLQFLDDVYNAFDQLCDKFGLQKIETVGKTYMACGGLKSAEKKIEARLLNRHHSVRVTDFGMEIAQFVETQFLKSGKHLEVNIGIHSGPVISGVVGDTKPQFSLIGDSVNKTSRVCSLTQPLKVTVSKETLKHLELYTNNYSFSRTNVEMKGIGLEPIYYVRHMKGRTRNQQAIKKFDGKLTSTSQAVDNEIEKGQDDIRTNSNNPGLINDDDSNESNAGGKVE
jgi:class 3 adenylate cyclase